MTLYNLALCHHLHALNSKDGTKAKLEKALALYELAYTLLFTEDTQATVFQQMAIINNIGHIHAILQNVECSRQCFENLLSTIMCVKDCGEEDEMVDIDGFLWNALPVNTGCALAAAA
jgi:hypothetical protein